MGSRVQLNGLFERSQAHRRVIDFQRCAHQLGRYVELAHLALERPDALCHGFTIGRVAHCREKPAIGL